MNSRIINLLINNPNFYTKDDISKIFNLNSKKLDSNIISLENLGYKIEFSPYGTILAFPEENLDIGENLSDKELEKLNAFEFFKELIVYDSHISMDAFKGTELESVLNEMIEDRYLIVDKGILHIPTDMLDNISDEPMLKLLIILNVLRKYHHYGSILNNIYYKVSTKYVERGYSFDPNIIIYGQRTSASTLSTEIALNIIKSIDNNNTITFNYKSNPKLQAQSITINPALLIYSGIRKSWYLLSTDENVYRLDRIEGEIKLGGTFSCPQINLEQYKNSLIISNEPEIHIELRFKNAPYIYNRLVRYSKGKKNTVIIQEETYLILKDIVNGILEITPFVKSFGSAITVVSPQKLKDTIIRDNQLLLERYGELNVQL